MTNRTVILCAFLALWPTWALRAQNGPPPAPVRVGEVLRENVTQRRTVVGSVEPARRSHVAAQVAGRVTLAPPEPGVPVSAGEPVARIDDVLLGAALDEAKAAVELASAAAREQSARKAIDERAVMRLRQLQATGAAQDPEVDDAVDRELAARARYELSLAELARAQALLRSAQERFEKSRVLAPFDGYVVMKETEIGQWLEPGDTVCQIVETRRVKVRLHVPQELVPFLGGPEMIPIHVDALSQTVHAPLFSIVPDADPQSRTFRVLVKLDNADGRISPGMSVSADLPTGAVSSALTVPRDAVLVSPTGRYVFANRGDVAVQVPVQVRFGHGDRFVVTGELKEGERVVVQGNERLRPGQPLRVLAETRVSGDSQ